MGAENDVTAGTACEGLGMPAKTPVELLLCQEGRAEAERAERDATSALLERVRGGIADVENGIEAAEGSLAGYRETRDCTKAVMGDVGLSSEEKASAVQACRIRPPGL